MEHKVPIEEEYLEKLTLEYPNELMKLFEIDVELKNEVSDKLEAIGLNRKNWNLAYETDKDCILILKFKKDKPDPEELAILENYSKMATLTIGKYTRPMVIVI